MAIHGYSWQFVFLKKYSLQNSKENPNSILESAVPFFPNTLSIFLFLQTELLNHKL